MTRRKSIPKWKKETPSSLEISQTRVISRPLFVKNSSLVLERLGHANRPATVRCSMEKFVIEPVPSGGVARYTDDDDGGSNGFPPFQLSLVLHSLMKNSLVDSATGSRLSMPRSFT